MKRKISIVLALALVLMVACAAHTPLRKAKVAQDIFISTLETTAKAMPTLEKKYPIKVKEIKKVFMQAKAAVQAYQYLLDAWEKTGEKPVSYDQVVADAWAAIGQLKKLGISMGVKYEY